jgi:hypothetical protein
MGEEEQTESEKVSCFKRARSWFVQLSFWKKIIIIFTLNTLILLILTDAIMLVLFGKISSGIIETSQSEKDQFNELSSNQIAQVSARMVLSQIDYYANVLAQMASAYSFFSQNPSLYTSLESTSPANPPLTASFPNASYAQPALYYYSNSSTFTALPFIDELLPQLLEPSEFLSNVMRINVYAQSTANGNDLTARTFPATQ